MRRRRSSGGRMLAITLDSGSAIPLYLQIYGSIRRSIVEGRLGAGALLPSSRVLSDDLAIARSTVVMAYEQLHAEGYLEGTVGAGTRVASVLPDALVRATAPSDVPVPAIGTASPLSARGVGIAARGVHSRDVGTGSGRAFRSGIPALDVFPVDLWARLAARRWQTSSSALLGYGDPCGHPRLRSAIANYLGAARGIRCAAEQVIVVSGSQQGFDLAARILLDPGDSVWLEDPGYVGARHAFAAAGATIVPVPVDERGLDVRVGERIAPDARLAFVTPSSQMPLQCVLAPERRTALLDWAASKRAWIFEDDYSGEFRYASPPLPAVQSLDRAGTVIYCGTFSKVLFPALRLAYLVVPPALVDAFAAVKRSCDIQSPQVPQAILADFIEAGHFERHLRRLRRHEHERQCVLVEAARTRLHGLLEIQPADAGWHVIGWLPEGASDVQVTQRAAAHGVDVLPLSSFATREVRPGLVLGFGSLSPQTIRLGVERLAEAMR